MAKIKAKRVGFSLDMTPMVDVAFLLLTFFMLTTQFRPPEKVSVSIPSSNSEIKLPESNVLMITVSKEGDFYLGVSDQPTRERIFKTFVEPSLSGMSSVQKIDSLKKFKLEESFLVEEDKLLNAITKARLANPKMRPVIKSDVETDFEKVNTVMQAFRETAMPTFNLMTTLE